MRGGLIFILLALLTACSGTAPGARIPTQEWQNIVIEVQTRPEPIEPGMNEFLILATEERGRPVHDLVVSVRTRQNEPWHQAIQDGFSGVYRRAMDVAASDTEVAVQIRRKETEETTELHFPLHGGEHQPQ